MKINGEMHYLWRAVDHEDEVLESFVTEKRDKSAALTFVKKAMKRHGRPVAIVTDGLHDCKRRIPSASLENSCRGGSVSLRRGPPCRAVG